MVVSTVELLTGIRASLPHCRMAFQLTRAWFRSAYAILCALLAGQKCDHMPETCQAFHCQVNWQEVPAIGMGVKVWLWGAGSLRIM